MADLPDYLLLAALAGIALGAGDLVWIALKFDTPNRSPRKMLAALANLPFGLKLFAAGAWLFGMAHALGGMFPEKHTLLVNLHVACSMFFAVNCLAFALWNTPE